MIASLLLLQPHLVFAQNQNVGFVETNIWYSVDPFLEGDKIKIYTLVFNPSSKNFKGTVAFFDKTTLLGKKDFAIPSLSAEAVFVDWTVTAGGHQVFARIENPRFEVSAGVYEEVYLANDETEKSERTVAKKLPDIKEVKEKINETLDSTTKPIEDFKEKITEKLPPSVSKPVDNALGFVEEIRFETANSIEEKLVEVKKEIKQMKELSNQTQEKDIDEAVNNESNPSSVPTKSDSKKEEQVGGGETKNSKTSGSVETPLKYVWLFFLTILSFIFKYQILFYLLSLVIIFLVIRLIFRLLKK